MDHFELTMYVFIYMLGYVLTAGLGLLRSVLFGSEAQRPLVLWAQRPLVLRAQRPPDWANTFAPATAYPQRGLLLTPRRGAASLG